MTPRERLDPLDAIAQTNLELLAQMEQRGYSVADRARIQRTYELTLRLTACSYRSSGRSLLEHLLGATSVVVSVNGSPDWVAATLVHAAYLHGDYGTLRRRIDAAQRAEMSALIGPVAEEILHRYTKLYLSERTIPALRAELANMDPRQREAIGIRIADQIDLYGTREVLYYSNVETRLDFARSSGPGVVVLARDLGYPTLAGVLERAYADALAHTVAPALTGPRWRDGVILPRSYRTRPSVQLYRAARTQIWRALGR